MLSQLLAATGGLVANLILSPIHEVPTLRVLGLYNISNILVLGFLLQSTLEISAAVLHFLQLNAAFLITLTVVTAIRRLYFHPLSHFPGRKRAALSKIYESYINALGQNARVIRQQHKQLGDFVRTGPNEISINHVDALKLLLRQGYDNRGPMMEIGKPIGDFNVLLTRDNEKHRQWRGIWDQAFRTKALQEYSPRIEHHVEKFIGVLEATKGACMNCTPLAANLAFDIMVDLGFGKEYGMQDGTGDPTYMDLLHGYMSAFVVVSSLRNLCDLFMILPKNKRTVAFQAKSNMMLNDRIKIGKSRQDVFTHFLNEDNDSGTKFTPSELFSNAQLLIIAGADTTSSVIANIFRELALSPRIQDKLYAEIRAAVAQSATFNCQNTKSLPYLQAVINEGLRLWNPIPSGVQALTGPQGATIAGRYIPPHTVTRVHHMTIMTDERNFPQGDKFIPERWTDDRDTGIKNIAAFIPFSYGPHSCVGKQLALDEMRLAVARVLERFTLELDPTHDEERYHEQWRDYFAVALGDIYMRFVPRHD